MDYKSYMGYGKKKTKKVEKTLSKKNSIIENVQNEIKDYPLERVLNEVGAGPDYKPHIMKINKLYHAYWDAVKDFTDLLLKKGAKKEANNLHRAYMKLVHKFNSLFVKTIRKIL